MELTTQERELLLEALTSFIEAGPEGQAKAERVNDLYVKIVGEQ